MGIWDKHLGTSEVRTSHEANQMDKTRCAVHWRDILTKMRDVATFNKPIANPKQTTHNQLIIKKNKQKQKSCR